MKKLFSVMLIGLLTIVIAACGGNEKEQTSSDSNSNIDVEIEEMKFRVAHNLPVEHHISKGVEKFADLVSEKSGEKIDVSIFPSGQLYDDKTMAEAVTTGQIEMGMNTFTMWAGQIPAAELYSLDLYPNYDAIAEGLQNGIHDIFSEELNKLGAQPVLWGDYGMGYYASVGEPLSSPEAYKGKKIRVLSPMGAKYVELAGGTPVTMGGGDVDQALQRGTIDGGSSGVTSFVSRQYYQYTDYFVGPKNAGMFLMSANLDWWNGLSDEVKDLITEAASEAQSWITEEVVKQETEAIEKLESEGMEHAELDEESFKEINEELIDFYIERSGEIGEKLVEIAREAAENNK